VSDGVAVSVIVPVRDDPDGVDEVLRRLELQTLPRERFEAVIGDDGSRAERAPRVASPDGRLRVVAGPPRTSYAARNRAAASARGAALAFCDADCRPRPEWLATALAALDGADLVAGEVIFAPPGRPSRWSLLTVDMFLDQERNVGFGRAVTANLVVRRALFERLRGFDESLPSGGDYDFVERALAEGARLVYAPDAVVEHPTLDRARPFLRKVWQTNRCSGARRARAGAELDPVGLLTFVPLFGAMLARRHARRPLLRLHAPRLRSAGVAPRWREEAAALLALYGVVCYVAGAARALGWLQGLAGRVPAPAFAPGDRE
jgi:GT2 family glycosyltransferase